ncbi:MAG: YtxH domain-containing protein [Vicingaceae bacterium]
MDNTGKVLLAVAAGAAAGLVAGVLLAPASGEETRENLKKQGDKLKKDLSRKMEDISDESKEKLESLKKTASSVVG